jgi:hypothetical protein
LSPYEKWVGKSPGWVKFLRTFGEVGIVQDGKKKKMSSKLDNKGFPAMFVGYPQNHAPDVYQMYNWVKRSLLLTRNVVWLGKTYAEFNKLPEDQVCIIPPTDETDDTISEILDDGGDIPIAGAPDIPQHDMFANPDIPDAPVPGTRIRGIDREIRNLTSWFNPNPREHIELEVPTPSVSEHDSGSENANVPAPTTDTETDSELEGEEVGLLGLIQEPYQMLPGFMHYCSQAMQTIVPGFDPFPKTYREAMNRKDKPNWKHAAYTEFANMHEKSVWIFFKKKNLPPGRKIIGCRWIFTIKDNGTYRARAVAKGYSQIPGKDFQENHAPVVHDTSFHLTLAQKLIFGLDSEQIDIETAFLYGDLEEEIYMEFPDGYEEYLSNELGCNFTSNEYCLLLKKSLYGLVQAARQWWKKITEVLKKAGFEPSPADPCLFVKKQKGNEPPAFIILYVDDGGVIGTRKVIDSVLTVLSKAFKVKTLGKMEHFVGCHIIQNKSKDTIYIHQPKLIKHLDEAFGFLMPSRVFKTPAAPKTVIMRPQEGDPRISANEQSIYRSGVGMLLYLIKHSRPDISNAVRELTKVLDGATSAHWKAMIRVIKYVFDTKNYALKIKPNVSTGKAILRGISDSEYAGDRETRISVYGYVIYYCGAPISWKSKSGKSVTLSSTEAEYYASSEAAKELVFVHNLIKSMGIELQLPIILQVDNTGAIYLANNYSTGPRTKHIDIRAHFVRELIVDGTLKIIFVKSEDNDADILTKNTSEELYEKHSSKMIKEKLND